MKKEEKTIYMTPRVHFVELTVASLLSASNPTSADTDPEEDQYA